MKKLTYSCVEELVDSIDEILEERFDEEDFDISIIAKYKEARDAIQYMAMLGYQLHSIEGLSEPSVNGYKDEFVVSIVVDDDVVEIWCQPMKNGDVYVTDESSITYVVGDCSSKLLGNLRGDLKYEVSLGEDECCCPECTCKESYSVNGKSVSKEEFEKFRKEVDERYLDTVRDMLLKHCSIMDEINEMYKLLY